MKKANPPKKVNKPRLLITSDCFLPRWDGIARVLYETIPYLAKSFEITVVCPDYGPQPDLPVTYVKFPLTKWQFGDFTLSKPDKKKLKSLVSNTDLVFNHTLGPIGWRTIKAAKKIDKPVVSYIHSIDWELFSRTVRFGRPLIYLVTRLAERIIYNRCALLMVPSSEVKQKMIDNKIKVPTEIVRLGVNTKAFTPAVDKYDAKRRLHLPTNSLVIGFHGRISREKNLRTLRRAFDRIKDRFYNTRLLIVGTGVREEEALFEIKRATLTGQTDNVVPYLQAMDIFVLPSLTETSSLATMEAMSCGLPVVVTRVGNTKHYIRNAVSGFFFKKKSPRSLAKVLTVLIRSEELRNRVGHTARQTALRKFDWEVTGKKMTEILKGLAGQK